jgi:hypothetical protein
MSDDKAPETVWISAAATAYTSEAASWGGVKYVLASVAEARIRELETLLRRAQIRLEQMQDAEIVSAISMALTPPRTPSADAPNKEPTT